MTVPMTVFIFIMATPYMCISAPMLGYNYNEVATPVSSVHNQVLDILQGGGYSDSSMHSVSEVKEVGLEYAIKDPIWNRVTLFRPDNPNIGMEHYMGNRFIQLPLANQ